MPRIVNHIGFLCRQLEDSRRIELRQDDALSMYQHRGGLYDTIEIGHELTKLRQTDRWGIVQAATLFEKPFMQSIQFTQDRDYPLQPIISLPEPVIPDRPFGEILRSRRSVRRFGGEPLQLNQLGSLLFGAVGETGQLVAAGSDQRPAAVSLRATPSAGALHPTRVFAVVLREGELALGVYHYDSVEHALELVRAFDSGERQKLLASFPVHPEMVDLERAAVVFVISSKFWRARAKYGARGYRYCLQEAGCACQNLNLTAVALGLGHVVLGGFYDDEIHSCLEIDGIDHAVVTAAAVGTLDKADQGSRHARS